MKHFISILFLIVFSRIRIIKWEYDFSNETMKSTDIVLGKNNRFYFSKGHWDGLMFSILGLGLDKLERDFFKTKFLHFNRKVTLYFLKWLFSYDLNGIYDNLGSCKIVYDKTVYDILIIKIYRLKHKIKYLFKDLYRLCNNIKINVLRKLFKKYQVEYNFTIDISWEGEYSFKSDIISAFQLACNYEADLWISGRIIFSPLGFEWEENNRLIKKFLGQSFKYSSLGYKNFNDKEIKRISGN